jgi:hypothetical protein
MTVYALVDVKEDVFLLMKPPFLTWFNKLLSRFFWKVH